MTAAAVDGCGGDGVFAAALIDANWLHQLHPITTYVNNDRRQQ